MKLYRIYEQYGTVSAWVRSYGKTAPVFVKNRRGRESSATSASPRDNQAPYCFRSSTVIPPGGAGAVLAPLSTSRTLCSPAGTVTHNPFTEAS